MDANDFIDVRYKGGEANSVSSIVISLEIDDLESPKAALELLETRFRLNEKVSMFDILAIWWYIRGENEKRKKAKED